MQGEFLRSGGAAGGKNFNTEGAEKLTEKHGDIFASVPFRVNSVPSVLNFFLAYAG
jgi:hypothetical protein